MGNPPTFRFYAADFDLDTNTWTNEEVGVYLRLLISEWVNGSLPSDQRRLAKIARLSFKKFQNVFPNIAHKFFENGQNCLYNRRLEEEREKQIIWREKSSLGGKKSAAKRTKIIQPPLEPPLEPNGQPNGNISFSFSNILVSNDTNCPQKQIVDLWNSLLPELPKVRQWTPAHQSNLRARWNEEKCRQNIEWWEEFFKYIRRCPFLMGQVEPTKDHPRFFVKLRWLVKAENFVKVLEGDYEPDRRRYE